MQNSRSPSLHSSLLTAMLLKFQLPLQPSLRSISSLFEVCFWAPLFRGPERLQRQEADTSYRAYLICFLLSAIMLMCYVLWSTLIIQKYNTSIHPTFTILITLLFTRKTVMSRQPELKPRPWLPMLRIRLPPSSG